MIEVKKGAEPNGLRRLREYCMREHLSPKDSYAMLSGSLKKKVLECLKRDQGQLCVYCMSKIPRIDRDPGIPGETIEHFIPLDPENELDVGQGLDYNNFFAVCHGNTRIRVKGMRRSSKKSSLTCDKHRGNMAFKKVNPLKPETLQSIFYDIDGKIGATDPDVNYDLVEILNLNCEVSPIVSERKSALDTLIADLGKVEDNYLHDYCVNMLNGFREEKELKTPYVGVLIWYLQSILDALS